MISSKNFTKTVLLVIGLSLVISFQSCKPDREKRKDRQVSYKPNIYIYPEESIQLNLTIDFPLGGEVIRSIPDYGNGWNISVDESGLINNQYPYLFYESKQPDIWQTTEGWIINVNELESFFRENMQAYGFEGQEIEDFIEYWIPKLKLYKYYTVCPQSADYIDDVIRLNFSKEPEELLRLFYLVEGTDLKPDQLDVPKIESFIREGYFVTEWGVIL